MGGCVNHDAGPVSSCSRQGGGLLEFISTSNGWSAIYQAGNLAGVDPVEQQYREEHQSCVEDVQVEFMREEISLVALEVLNHPKYRSGQD